MPGYTERIVRIHLKDNEGGLNLKMPPELIEALGELGGYAGDELLGFDFDEHRWRRLLAATAAMEKSFESLNRAFEKSFQEFLNDYQAAYDANGPTGSYKPGSAEKLAELKSRWEVLAAIAKLWSENPLRNDWSDRGNPMPRPRAALRFTPAEFVEAERE